MKLAEALIQRADGLKRIRELKSRLATSAKVQEGDQPFEDPRTLIAELEELMTRFQELVKRINRTNVQVELETGKTLADALAERDVLQMRSRIYTELQETSSNSPFGLRLSRSEIKYIFTIDMGENNRRIDALSKQYRELDTRIQQKNWSVDLVD